MIGMIKNCYIHIPFCDKICSYCDFCKLLYHEKFIDSYLCQLEKEIKSIYQKEKLDTIYIGGGTPSSLSLRQLERLFQILGMLKKSGNFEYTIECNFDSITEEKLILFKNNGINRLSFGIESTIDKNLKVLDRTIDKNRVISMIHLCRKLGFHNINVDLMYAIPGEDIQDLERDIDFILSLDTEHISTYSLIIEEHTKLFMDKTDYVSEDLDYEMYQLICNRLNNYQHYEISNFAKDGYYSRHNMCYWKNKNYYGFGLGASSYINDERRTNTKSINKYLNGYYILECEKLEKSDIMVYEMILGLRLLDGIVKEDFYLKYKKDIYEVFPIEELIKKGLLVDSGTNISIKKDKFYISNEILVSFIKE